MDKQIWCRSRVNVSCHQGPKEKQLDFSEAFKMVNLLFISEALKHSTAKSLLWRRTKLSCVVQNYYSLSINRYFFHRVTGFAWSFIKYQRCPLAHSKPTPQKWRQHDKIRICNIWLQFANVKSCYEWKLTKSGRCLTSTYDVASQAKLKHNLRHFFCFLFYNTAWKVF